ncbi:MAG: amidohydrolase [Rhodospirillales bacterium]|nr:MAG: amidohydrolase [Rhodospirillales bacterium]
MSIDPGIAELIPEMTAWRHDFHAHPEIAWQEKRTSARLAELLGSFGYEVTAGLAGTGVVGTLKGRGQKSVMLRSDMDALPIREEAPDRAHCSRNQGCMHGCGHDGHMAMLLGAAKVLANRNDLSGTLHLLFQPAEENEAGARRLIEEGLFQRFPADAIFGLHNWPGMPAGTMGVRPGAMMASCDLFEIELSGRGTHAAMPHLGQDVILAAAQLVSSLQAIVSRETDPLDAAVVSVTVIEAGTTWNVMPSSARLRGTARALKPGTRDFLERRIGEIAKGLAQAFGLQVRLTYDRRYPPTINHEGETGIAAQAARLVVGETHLSTDIAPSMGAEDFAFLLAERPGAYAWLGAGREGMAGLHNPTYDFNDDILAIGASWWVAVAEMSLEA